MATSLKIYRALIEAVTAINNVAAQLRDERTDKETAAKIARDAAQKLIDDLEG